MKSGFILIGFLVSLASIHAAEFQILESRRYHLRSGTNVEWQEFAASAPRGSRLDVPFTAEENATESTLFLWQDDVKQDWRVELNGRRLGSLFLMESPLTMALRIPAGLLRDGSNSVAIVPPRQNDDIRVGELKLAPAALESVLTQCAADLVVTDAATGEAIPCRITVSDTHGSLAALRVSTNQNLAERPGVIYAGNGRATVNLLPGSYTFSATRGFEFSLAATNIILRAGDRRTVALQLRREVSTPGLVSSDTHIHTFTHSKHGDATVHERVITLAGEGIELPIATDHDIAVDLEPTATAAGVRKHFTPVIGDEVTTRVGHFNIFPVTKDAPVPSNLETNWTVLLDSFRATPGVEIVIFNHPRNIHNGFQPFARTNFNRMTGEARWPFDFRFDAMELINSSAQQSDYMSVFEDWFALLNAGHRITAVGSSDGHDVSRYIVGQGRTYIECPDGEVARLDVNAVCRNLKAGRAYVSMGLLPIMTVNNAFRAGALVTNLSGVLKVNVKVLAPSWIAADRIELFANGTKVRTATISSRPGRETGVAAEVQWELPRPRHDVHLVAIATGPGQTAPHWPVAKPYQPASAQWTSRVIGATNPIWADGDADGRYSAPSEYAAALLQQAGGDIRRFVTSLQAYDEATMIQAAAAARRSGLNLTSRTFQQALAATTPPLARAFGRVIDEESGLRQ